MVSKASLRIANLDAALTSAHLLSDHDNSRSLNRTSKARNLEELDESRKDTGLCRKTRLLDENFFLFHLCVNEEQLSRCQEFVASKSKQCTVCFVKLALGHEPSGEASVNRSAHEISEYCAPWRLGHEVYADEKRNGRDKSRA